MVFWLVVFYFTVFKKRHSVNYGIARPGEKRIAIPYLGADTPEYHSEFSYSDVGIVFTLLAYYNDGVR